MSEKNDLVAEASRVYAKALESGLDESAAMCSVIDTLQGKIAHSVPPAPRMEESVCESDRARIEWCVSTVRAIADLGRDKPLGDLYPEAVQVCGTLKRVLQPNIVGA